MALGAGLFERYIDQPVQRLAARNQLKAQQQLAQARAQQEQSYVRRLADPARATDVESSVLDVLGYPPAENDPERIVQAREALRQALFPDRKATKTKPAEPGVVPDLQSDAGKAALRAALRRYGVNLGDQAPLKTAKDPAVLLQVLAQAQGDAGKAIAARVAERINAGLATDGWNRAGLYAGSVTGAAATLPLVTELGQLVLGTVGLMGGEEELSPVLQQAAVAAAQQASGGRG